MAIHKLANENRLKDVSEALMPIAPCCCKRERVEGSGEGRVPSEVSAIFWHCTGDRLRETASPSLSSQEPLRKRARQEIVSAEAAAAAVAAPAAAVREAPFVFATLESLRTTEMLDDDGGGSSGSSSSCEFDVEERFKDDTSSQSTTATSQPSSPGCAPSVRSKRVRRRRSRVKKQGSPSSSSSSSHRSSHLSTASASVAAAVASTIPCDHVTIAATMEAEAIFAAALPRLRSGHERRAGRVGPSAKSTAPPRRRHCRRSSADVGARVIDADCVHSSPLHATDGANKVVVVVVVEDRHDANKQDQVLRSREQEQEQQQQEQQHDQIRSADTIMRCGCCSCEIADGSARCSECGTWTDEQVIDYVAMMAFGSKVYW
jgi:hypothetical protein